MVLVPSPLLSKETNGVAQTGEFVPLAGIVPTNNVRPRLSIYDSYSEVQMSAGT